MAKRNDISNFYSEHPRNWFERLVEIGPVVTGEVSFEFFFLFLALIAILCRGTERFEQFW